MKLFSHLNQNAVSAVLNKVTLETSSTALYSELKGQNLSNTGQTSQLTGEGEILCF